MAETKLHAIMIVFSYQGHITPFTNLALKLASNGCTITYVNTEFIHHMLTKAHKDDNVEEVDLFFRARASGLDINYTTIYDGFPPDYDRILNFDEYWLSILRDFPARVDELVGKIIESNEASSSVPFLIADTFYSWPATIAKKYNILNVSFWTEPALVFCIDSHLDLMKENGHFPSKGNKEDIIDFIPGVGPILVKDLMSYLQDLDITTVTHQIVIKGFEQVKCADFVLINTVNELEHETVIALNQKQPTYAIGPINFQTDHFTKTVVPKSLWSETDCTEWINSKPPGSVLYVSFGSLAQINKHLAEEIAHGLLLSEVNFIWTIRDDTDILPDGFRDKIKNKGYIVQWCNQNAVLSNPAIGGFLTHCGWNSVLESIWCGIPMICCPFYVDQPTNRKLVVDDWKIGINLCDGESFDREEIAEKIKQVISEETSNGLRDEIKKIRMIMHKAMAEDGSTERNFHQFLEDLRSKIDAISQEIPTQMK